MATFKERDSGGWQAVIRRKGFPPKSKTFPTRVEAEDWAREIEREMRRGEFKDRAEAEKNTFAKILKRYNEEITPRKKGKDVESIIIRGLINDPLSKHKMTALTAPVLAEWRDRRLKDVCGSTVNREIDVISSVINYARKEWGIHIENPVGLIHRPPKGKARDRRLVGDEEQRLLDALEETPRREDGTYDKGARNPWLRSVVEFAIETAMRRGEILKLRWEHVHLSDAYVKIFDTKNGEDREVPLSRKAVKLLEGLHPGKGAKGEVFNLTANALKKGFERARDRAGIKDFNFHDLRHEAASRISLKLSNVLELSAVTGHKDLRMLKRYYHPKAKDLAPKLD